MEIKKNKHSRTRGIGQGMSNVGQIWPDVFRAYLGDYSVKLSASDIARKIGFERRTVSRVLSSLAKLNLVKYKLVGRNKVFYLDLDSPKSKILLEIAENKKALDFSLGNTEVFLIVKELLGDCSSVIVFGSYALGKNKKNSDLDLVIFECKNKKKMKQIKENHLVEINEHCVTYVEFQRLLQKKQALSLEILGNHVLFGDVSKIVNLFKEKKNG